MKVSMLFNLALVILLGACNKEEVGNQKLVTSCPDVSIFIKNDLSANISDLSINGVTVGDITKSELSEEICLPTVLIEGADPRISYVQLKGEFQGEIFGEETQAICGTGLMSTNEGVYLISITDIVEGYAYYE